MASVTPKLQAYRASILHFTADPAFEANSYQWHEEGLLLVADGCIVASGGYAQLHHRLAPETAVVGR